MAIRPAAPDDGFTDDDGFAGERTAADDRSAAADRAADRSVAGDRSAADGSAADDRSAAAGFAADDGFDDDDGFAEDAFADDGLRKAPAEPVVAKQWRVDRRLTIVKFALTVAFVLLATVIQTTSAGRVVAAVGALATLLWGLRDVVAPLRLAADQDGVTVLSGLRDYRQIPWSQVERVRLEPRPRFGGRLLEVDAGESLHFFGRYDLGEPPADALDTLTAIRGGQLS